jgi:hypothetical protein
MAAAWLASSDAARAPLRATGSLPLCCTFDGIPCTSVARTLVDLATVATTPELERALEQSITLNLFDRAAVENGRTPRHCAPATSDGRAHQRSSARQP